MWVIIYTVLLVFFSVTKKHCYQNAASVLLIFNLLTSLCNSSEVELCIPSFSKTLAYSFFYCDI